ncbi:ATP-binding cassette domain-containing protein, partial [Acidomonas methanolica]
MSDIETILHPEAETLTAQPAPSLPGLVAHGIGKSYKKRPVVRNVSLSVQRGEAVGLLGPNGAGKTTSFYMIVGLVQPDTGAITLDGA